MSIVYCEICDVEYDTDEETRQEHASENHTVKLKELPK